MNSLARNTLGFVLAPAASSVFVSGLAVLYSRIEWPGTFLTVLAIGYPTAVVLGIPAHWFLKARKRQCVFRLMPAPDSAACRPPIPRHAGRGFRGMSPPSLEVIPSRG